MATTATEPVKSTRIRTPTVLQMESVECGAAALTIVLWHYGRFEPLERMREECGVSRDGSKAGDIAKAARRFGLIAKGYRKEPDELAAMHMPLIVYWNFNHFIVVEGFGKDEVYVNNPASGPGTVSKEEFDNSFTGVVLELEPGPDFEKSGHAPSLTASLRTRLAGSRVAITYAVLAGLALVIPGLLVPTFTRVFVDDVLVGGSSSWAKPLVLAMLATAIVRGVLTHLQQKYLLRLESRMALSTSSRFLWHVLRLPMKFFDQRFGGEIGNRVATNDRVAHLLSGQLAMAAINVTVIGFFALLMLQYDVMLTVIVVAISALNVAALRYVSRLRRDRNQSLLQERAKLYTTAIGGLSIIETLKASASEADFFARWSGHHAKVVNGLQQLGVPTQALGAVPPMLTALATAAILGVGSLRVMEGVMSMGMLAAFQSLAFSFTTPVNDLVALGSVLQDTEGDMTRLDDVVRFEIDPARDSALATAPIETPKLSGRIELKDVTFGYSKLAPPLIENFNLSVAPGARIALVGGSGSGKSTLSKVLTGLYEPWSGEVLFDGKSRAGIPRAVMSNSLALVDQKTVLYDGTVRDNLTLWDTTIPESSVVQAAKDAVIHDDIDQRSGGYDAAVGEGGRNFSGGQRQRLDIARALALNPSIIVLDEATSALDARTEQLVDDALRRRGCTCFIIAHRLSTIRDCDEIIVLDRGKVVQRGTHETMAAVDGPYTTLIHAE